MTEETKNILEVWITAANCIFVGLTCIFIFIYRHSAVDAVKVGRKLNDEQQKDAAKRILFLTLFAYRGSPINQFFVNGLNQIDIVFHDNSSVLDAWHAHLSELNNDKSPDRARTWESSRLQILSRMAESLGYGSLRQADLMEHYYPQGHGEQNEEEKALRQSAIKFFQKGDILYQLMIENTKPRQQDKESKKD